MQAADISTIVQTIKHSPVEQGEIAMKYTRVTAYKI
jgi:hypothetical protein